ncbi:hypothetical protein [Phreatobacter stygius]|uniref:Uncharacterized protein n=1 Tax=Phreatobacter stygius TaxID=1940610 RepID=A0A4D7B6F0_9HYPH|nr:hypothetical protein [Phreatobacter stygius]QCI63557.1 hypothetical protein E8M01_04480 [Phreatobacter stygius]
MIAKLTAAALLLITGALHLYQYVLSPPTLPVLVTVLFGAVYVVLALVVPFGGRRGLITAQIVTAIGGFMAIASVVQDQQPLTVWIAIFVAFDLAVIWFCAWAKAELAAR